MEAAGSDAEPKFNFERDIDTYIPIEVTETRLTGGCSSYHAACLPASYIGRFVLHGEKFTCAGLLQSLLVAACLGLTPVLQRIPSAVLWGYFAFMALESLKGSQFWERMLYLLTDPAKRYRYGLPANRR